MSNLHLDKDTAHRTIARLLRENKMNAEEANKISSKIIDALKATPSASTQPVLKGWRMISEKMPTSLANQFVRELSVILHEKDIDVADAPLIWRAVYNCGRNVPSSVVV